MLHCQSYIHPFVFGRVVFLCKPSFPTFVVCHGWEHDGSCRIRTTWGSLRWKLVNPPRFPDNIRPDRGPDTTGPGQAGPGHTINHTG